MTIGHDEDGDGIADANDPCPHIAGTADDTDGDLVGDACDREPANPRQSWIHFEPFIDGASTFFSTPGGWIRKADSIECAAGATTQILRSINVADLDVVVGVDTLAFSGGTHNIGIVVRLVGQPYYYGELFGNAPNSYLEVMEYDGATYSMLNRSVLATTTPVGSGDLRLRTTTGSTPTFSLDGTLAGMTTFASNATPNYTGGDIVVIGFTNVAADVRYVALIASDPP